VVDPDAADAVAKADQRARIEAFGGRDAILSRGSFAYSPAPGTKAMFN
jgi:choline-sulfatase